MLPLNPNRERFAQAIAAGTRGADAYSALYPKASRKTATEKASRWARSSHIRARIDELRSTMASAQAKRDADVARDVASKLTVALLTCQERRSLIAARARSPKTSDSALARLLYLDAQLAGDLVEQQDHTSNGETLPSIMPKIVLNLPEEFLNRRQGNLSGAE